MKKSTVIGTCLANSNIVSGPDDGEYIVAQVFAKEYPAIQYHEWNSDINDATAQRIIQNIGNDARIDVKTFIDALWDVR
jgi:hypothetical protein